jgi:hypothetical protein
MPIMPAPLAEGTDIDSIVELRISINAVSAPLAETVSLTGCPGACLRALVKHSWMSRYAVRSLIGGRPDSSVSDPCTVTSVPAARHSSISWGNSAAVGWSPPPS